MIITFTAGCTNGASVADTSMSVERLTNSGVFLFMVHSDASSSTCANDERFETVKDNLKWDVKYFKNVLFKLEEYEESGASTTGLPSSSSGSPASSPTDPGAKDPTENSGGGKPEAMGTSGEMAPDRPRHLCRRDDFDYRSHGGRSQSSSSSRATKEAPERVGCTTSEVERRTVEIENEITWTKIGQEIARIKERQAESAEENRLPIRNRNGNRSERRHFEPWRWIGNAREVVHVDGVHHNCDEVSAEEANESWAEDSTRKPPQRRAESEAKVSGDRLKETA